MKRKIVIIEDQEDVQIMMIEILKMNKELKILGVFSDGKSSLQNIPYLLPDIVLVDIGLPDISGIECIRILKKKYPVTEFMVWSSFGDEENIVNALEAGASSYLLKNTSPDTILRSIDELSNGGSPMSPEIARVLVNKFFRRPERNEIHSNSLTNRELEILNLLSKGLLYKEISDNLQISINTIKVHCYNIYQKLHVTNKVEALNKVFGGSVSKENNLTSNSKPNKNLQ